MKNTFGNAVTVTLFGESHGKAVGAVIDGLSPGIPIDEEYIREKMNLRKAYGKISTARQEEDEVKFISGVFRERRSPSLSKIKIPRVRITAAGCIFRDRRMPTTPDIANMPDTRIIAAAGIFREGSLQRWLLPGLWL